MLTLSKELIPKLQVILRSGNLISCKPNWGCTNKTNNYNMLYFVLDGKFIYEINNKHFLVRPNQMVLIPENTPYSCYLTKEKKLQKYFVHFFATVNEKDLFQLLGFSEDNYVVNFPESATVEKLFRDLFFFQNFYSDTAIRIHQQAILTEIIATYIDKCFTTASSIPARQEKFQPVLEYMAQHLSGTLALDELAHLVPMNKNQFVREFKQAFGVPPMHYFDNLRIERAMQLLRETDSPIQLVSYAVGITDQAYFSRFFKNRTSLSPSEYRRSFQ